MIEVFIGGNARNKVPLMYHAKCLAVETKHSGYGQGMQEL